MSDTDIYKKRERMPYTGQPAKRTNRRRRSTRSRRAFDESNRKRRSSNSGLRRLIHLYRKKENEKYFWWTVLWLLVIGLLALAVWQFLVSDFMIRNQEQEADYNRYQQTASEVETALPAE